MIFTGGKKKEGKNKQKNPETGDRYPKGIHYPYVQFLF